jgi:glucose/arabinose dehydrogenase
MKRYLYFFHWAFMGSVIAGSMLMFTACSPTAPTIIDALPTPTSSTEMEPTPSPQPSQVEAPTADTDDIEEMPALELVQPYDADAASDESNLLNQAEMIVQCDHTENALVTCLLDELPQRISLEFDASNFARWALQIPDAGIGLTGNEVLAIELSTEGHIDLNLYLVTEDGERILRRLPGAHDHEDTITVYFPLWELRADTGMWFDAAFLKEIQLVFEWADMVGAVNLHALRFLDVWKEPVEIVDLQDPISAPEGFTVEVVATNLLALTQIEVISADTLLASTQNGRVWLYRDQDGDGFFEYRQLYVSGFWEVVGLLYDPVDNAVWIGGRGELWRTLDMNGNGSADLLEQRIDGLPWGRHQNNGLIWNPVDDPFSGEPPYSWIYFGLGSTGDLEVGEEFSATVLRFPRDGNGSEDLEIVAEGVRNAYGLIWAPISHDETDAASGVDWALFAGENGPDFNDAPDEVNHIRWGHHYGFPTHFGMVTPPDVENRPYSSPVYEVTPHASANSLAYITNLEWPEAYRTLYVSLFGSVFSPEPVGQTVDRVQLTPVESQDGRTYQGNADVFIQGLQRPLPLNVDTDGNLLIGDYATGIIYRVRYIGAE